MRLPIVSNYCLHARWLLFGNIRDALAFLSKDCCSDIRSTLIKKSKVDGKVLDFRSEGGWEAEGWNGEDYWEKFRDGALITNLNDVGRLNKAAGWNCP